MAHLGVDGRDLLVRLSVPEKLGALHNSVRVPRATVTAVAPTESAWQELRGLRVPGTGLPGVVALGTWRYRGGKDFVAVYRGTGVIVTLSGGEWTRLVVSTPDPRRVCEEIDARR